MLNVAPITPAQRAAREAGLSVLRRAGVFDGTPEPEFDRWTTALRRETGAAVAALWLLGASRSFVKSCAAAPRAEGTATKITLDPSGSSDEAHVRLHAPVTFDGQLLDRYASSTTFPASGATLIGELSRTPPQPFAPRSGSAWPSTRQRASRSW